MAAGPGCCLPSAPAYSPSVEGDLCLLHVTIDTEDNKGVWVCGFQCSGCGPE